jgi:type I restriction enzyme S subunit
VSAKPKSQAAAAARTPDGWEVVRFGEIANCIGDRVDDPSKAGVERYVGLEHLDPESLKIRRWGKPTDVEAQKLRFKPGDIIFGKRRAYQKKLAVADFEGICSAHAMVLRANTERIEKDFLPFFMQSDVFFDRALAISVGSLSPTINWRTLAEQEFLLPPRKKQVEMAEIMWAIEAVIRAHEAVVESTSAARSAVLRDAVFGSEISEARTTPIGRVRSNCRVLPLGEILSHCQYGLSIPVAESGQYPILRMMNLVRGRVVANDIKFVDLEKGEFDAYRVRKGDILFNRTNSADLVGKVGLFDLDGDYVFASYLLRLSADKRQVMPEYLNIFLNSDEGQKQILAYATPGVSQSNVNAENLRKIWVPVPSGDIQRQITSEAERFDRVTKSGENQLNDLRCLKKLIFSNGGPHVQ